MQKAFCLAALLAAAVAFGAAATAAETQQRGEFAFQTGTAPDWVQAHDLPAEWDAKAPGASGESWRYWLIDLQADRRGKARARYYDYAYEPLASEMLSDAAKIEIDFLPDFQQLTIHDVSVRRDGRWQKRLNPAQVTLARRETSFEQDMTTGAVTALLVLEDLRPHDVVRVRYTIEGENPILAGLDDERAPFGAAAPILQRELRVLFDAQASVDVRRLNGAPETTETVHEGTRELRASAHALAKRRNEGAYPLWYWRTPQIALAERHRWADVAAWARALYPPYQPLPSDLEQRISDWKKLPHVEDRVAAALEAVQEQVRYFGTEIGANTHRPAEPGETWRVRYGDCKDKARLLAALLDRLGVAAHPALVSSTHGRGVQDLPPSAAAFDHVIVEVELAGETLWLDPTQMQQRGPLRGLDHADFGMALPIAPQTNDLVAVSAPSAVDRIRTRERFVAAADGSVALDIETRYTGVAAEQLRRALQLHGQTEMERRYVDFYRKRYGDVVGQPVSFVRDDTNNALVVSEKYQLSNPWSTSTPGLHVLETYADEIGSRITLPDIMQREGPLAISHPTDVEQIVDLVLPSGWRWQGEAQSRKIEDAFTRYEKTVRGDAGAVNVTQHYVASRDADDSAAANKHLQSLRELNDLVGQRLVLALPEQAADQRRRERLENALRDILDDKGARK